VSRWKARDYDLDGRLTEVVSAGTSTYSFFDDGSIASRSDDTEHDYSVIAGATTVAVSATSNQLVSTTGTMARTYAYDQAGNTLSNYYVHTNHLNTPRRVTRASDNTIVWRWSSDPYGLGFVDEDPDGDGQAFIYSLRFPGQYYDVETGLNYNRARDYDPTTGRYVESDPIGLDGGSYSTYAYGGENPIGNVDATGLIKWNGEIYSLLASSPFGYSRFHLDLKSDCVNGKYAYVYVSAWAAIAGEGLEVTGGGGPISLDDGNPNIEPQGLGGTFRVFSAGAGIGLTYGWAYVQLGDAFSTPNAKPDPAIGFDASFVGGTGKSNVTHVEIKDCPCNR